MSAKKEVAAVVVFGVVAFWVIFMALTIFSSQKPAGHPLVPSIPYVIGTITPSSTYYSIANYTGRTLSVRCEDCQSDDVIICKRER